MKTKYYLSLYLLLVLGQGFAQLADFPMSPLAPNDLENTSWERTGDIFIHPFNDEISVSQGGEIWMSSVEGAILQTKKSLGEVKLRFQMMQSGFATTHLVLQNNYKINLSNASNGTKPIMGTIVLSDGKVINPNSNASRAVGLWNDVELVFKPSMNGKPGILEKLTINGVKVHTNVFLPKNEATFTKVAFVHVDGTTALKSIESLSFEQKTPLQLQNITYSVKEAADWVLDYDKSADGIVNGSIEQLTHELPHDYQRYQTLYEADLQVAEDGYYAFTLDFAGRAKLFIDGEEIVGSVKNAVRQPQIGTKKLNKGIYKLQYVYQKVWWPAQVGLYFSGSTFRPYPVHASRSLSVARLAGGIYVNPEGSKPKIVRGFMMHDGEKRTEVVSVGDPSGVHYSIDLEMGSIIQAWRGDFADVTEMWHNRGEPQLLKPLGLSTELGGSKIAFDAYISDLSYDKYILNSKGEPTFYFKLGEASFTKKVLPSKGGLEVTLDINSPTALSFVLAEGDRIVDLGDGVYKVDDTYFKTLGENIQILKMDKKQLVFLGDQKTKALNYKIVW